MANQNKKVKVNEVARTFMNKFLDVYAGLVPDYTDVSLAKELKCNNKTIGNYKSGTREPGLNFVMSCIKVCQKYNPNISAETILGLTDINLAMTTSVSDFIGLSNEAVTKLRVMKDNTDYLKLINWIIENDALINFVDLFTEADNITDERDKKVLQFDQEMICRNFADEIINNRNKIKRPMRADSLIYDNVKYELVPTNLTKERAEATLEYLKLNRKKKEKKED